MKKLFLLIASAVCAGALAVSCNDPLMDLDGTKWHIYMTEDRLNGKVAFTFGPYVLARDEEKDNRRVTAPVRPRKKDGKLCYALLPCEAGEQVRLRLKTARGEILLTDYASCGKHWHDSDALMTVWMPTRPRLFRKHK